MRSPFHELNIQQSIVLFSAMTLFATGQNSNWMSKLFVQKILCIAGSIFSFFFIASHLFHESNIHHEDVHFFLNQNLSATFALLNFFIALHLWNSSENQNNRWLCVPAGNQEIIAAVSAIISFAAFYFAKSIAGWMGLCAAAAYLLHKKMGLSAKSKLIFGVFSIAILIAAVLICHSSSIIDRWRWWQTAIRIWMMHPLIGSGPGSFEKVAGFYSVRGLKSVFAHSYPLQIAAEWGLLGAAFLFSYWTSIISRSTTYFLSAGLIAILTQNLFDFSLNIPGIALIFWLILGHASSENLPALTLRPAGAASILIFALIASALFFAGWRWGIKPLLAWRESLIAEEALERGDIISTETHLRKTIFWDSVPAKYYSDLSEILYLRYQREPANQTLMDESVRMAREALRRDPFSESSWMRLSALLDIARKR